MANGNERHAHPAVAERTGRRGGDLAGQGRSIRAKPSYPTGNLASALLDRLPDQGAPPEGTQWRRWARATGNALRKHRLFCVVLLVATIVRFIAMLAYPPAMWTSDSLRYVTLATHLIPYQIQPVGYSVMLTLLAPFHSLALVAGIQHAMGL